MKKVKRKYTRKPKQDTPQSISSPTKEESNIIMPSEFSFNDLPFSLRMQVESIIKARKRLGLPDDSKERKERTVKYFKGDRLR